jgi:hypothetical protein
MTPLEVAMKLASASSKCEKHKCLFMSQCKGDYSTCVMKEIALLLRSQNAEIDSLKSLVKAYNEILASTQVYIAEIEKINKRYHDLCIAFEHGYRPKNVKRLKRAPKPKKDPAEMDGDIRYAQEPEKKPEPPLVVI